MFVILVYDTPAKRTQLFLEIGRKYLVHTQNSLLIGDITESKFLKMKRELSSILEEDDNILLIHALNRNNVDITVLSKNGDAPGRVKESDNSFHKKDAWII